MRKVFHSLSTDPAVNLAWEEILVSTCQPDDELLFLWQNRNTVVIGRNQNPWKESNVDYLKSIGGTLVRRKSGGGAVYHDMGNLNFTFISKYEKDEVSRNLAFIIHVLAGFGIEAAFHGRNDLLVDGAKVSGNAYYTEEGILCHHGTLLVEVDFAVLVKMLTVSEKKLKSNGVDSVRSSVANLKEFNPSIKVRDLLEVLSKQYLKMENWQQEVVLLSDLPSEYVALKESYRSWHWNYGESPGFDIEMELRFSWGGLIMELKVTDGTIDDAKVYTDALEVDMAVLVRETLIGQPYDEDSVIERIVNRFGS